MRTRTTTKNNNESGNISINIKCRFNDLIFLVPAMSVCHKTMDKCQDLKLKIPLYECGCVSVVSLVALRFYKLIFFDHLRYIYRNPTIVGKIIAKNKTNEEQWRPVI